MKLRWVRQLRSLLLVFRICDSNKNSCVCLRLTHISLAYFLCRIGKHGETRSDATKRGVWSGSPMFANRSFFQNLKENEKYHPAAIKLEMIRMGKYIRHKWVKEWLNTNVISTIISWAQGHLSVLLPVFCTVNTFCPLKNFFTVNHSDRIGGKRNRRSYIKIVRNKVFDCHLSPDWRQMAIGNTVYSDFWSAFVDW